MDVDVVVRKGDRVVASIKRPLREIGGAPAVTYRGQLWPLNDGSIDIQAGLAAPAAGLQRPESSPGAPEMDTDQQRIVEAPVHARILVPAGPGSGKTEVTARRIAHLLSEGLSPSRLLILSFSRSAVRTLTRRLKHLSATAPELEDLRHVAIRTFDSWAFRLLRLSGEQPGELLCRTHESNIQAAVDLLSGDRASDEVARLGKKTHIFVDEFQDLTGSRARLVEQLLLNLAPPGSRDCGFTLLGDPAQAIYGFTAGGELSGMQLWDRIRSSYPEAETLALTRNHRATGKIASFADGLRSVLESSVKPAGKLERVRKALHGLPAPKEELGPGWVDRPYSSSAILARTNGEALRVAQKLLGSDLAAPAGVLLRAGSWAPSAPPWIAALLSPMQASTVTRANFDKICAATHTRLGEAACEALAIPPCEVAWGRLLRATDRPDSDQSVPLADLRARIDWPDAFPDDEQQPDRGLFVTTVHQSKGMEFDEVHLLDPEGAAKEAKDPLEEASVGFVGATRAARHLGRIPADGFQAPLSRREFADGRVRLSRWCRNGRLNIEMGIPGDVDAASFVDVNVHGTAEEVLRVQQFMLDGAADLAGRKVMLVRVVPQPKRAFYDIHVQEEDGPGQKIGRTKAQLTLDLLRLLHKKGYSLPSTIFNLRIAGLCTLTAGDHVDAAIPEPFSKSRLWLGCSLMGTGDFRPLKRKGR